VNEEEVSRHARQLRDGPPDPLGALIIVTIGIILLANNFQVLSWDIWFFIGRFWPVVVIFIGLNIFSGNSVFLRLITTLIGIIIILFIITYSLYNVEPRFKSYINNNFPKWEQIYNSIPSNVEPDRQRYYIQELYSI
jgi:hypothetical protein